MSTTAVQTSLRNADLSSLVELLKAQQDVRYDVVASADRVRFEHGNLVVNDGASDVIGVNPDGSFAEAASNAILRPTDVFDSGISQRLGIPRNYVRKLRDTAVAHEDDDENAYADLLDHNVNVWLAENPGQTFLIRGFLASGDNEGIARAFLSSKHAQYDNLDILLASLDGAKRTGAQLQIVSADLSERNLRVKVACPEVAALAPELLKGYRNPFVDNDQRGGWTLEAGRRAAAAEGLGFRPGDEPVVFAGFIIGNSETGNGKWSITPSLTVQVCRNGLTFTKEAFGKVHIGGRLDEGIIDWSADTKRKNIELISAQTADVVSNFLSIKYVEDKVAQIEAKAGVVVAKPTETLAKISKDFGFSEAEADLILADFIIGGQSTAGGILNAITSAVQRVEDPDRASEIEDIALDVFASVSG